MISLRNRQAAPALEQRVVVIGILNNMPDSALRTTEAQLEGLLHEAALPNVELRVRYFALPDIERGAAAQAHMCGRYETSDALMDGGVDGLIVTGTEPREEMLEDEVYWTGLCRVIDWAAKVQIPAVWSCLAAHAAVRRLNGVARTRLAAKRSGVFELVRNPHPLLTDAPEKSRSPHSRLNELRAEHIERAGYEVLTWSPEVGVDTFVLADRPTSLFFQGHPEYDANTLGREYLRDVSRYLRLQRQHHPRLPAHYFDLQTAKALYILSEEAERARDVGLIDAYARLIEASSPPMSWRPWSLHIYRAWLSIIECDDRHARSSDEGRRRFPRVEVGLAPGV